MMLFLLTAGLAGLVLFTRKGRMLARRIRATRLTTPALIMALGGLLALKGQPLVGSGLILAALLWAGRTVAARRPLSHAPDAALDAQLDAARALLGVPRGADRARIIAAHRRLMLDAHPDIGGNDLAASRLNAARDLLIDHSGA